MLKFQPSPPTEWLLILLEDSETVGNFYFLDLLVGLQKAACVGAGASAGDGGASGGPGSWPQNRGCSLASDDAGESHRDGWGGCGFPLG